jgi:uncharacterized membrane protein
MAKVVKGLAFLVYPLAIYLGLTRWDVQRSAWLLMLGAVLSVATNWRGQSLRGTWLAPSLVLALALLGRFLDNRLYLLLLPASINAALLVTFGASLFSPVPMVERFARLQVSDLSEAECRYCRKVTWLWCVFFLLNGSAAALLAAFGSVATWAIYVGCISYVLVGLVMSVEYLCRKYRFRRFGTGWHDRVLAWVLVPRPGQP